jgi:acetoin utilization deacetylase AcuC-like enzyme
MAAPTPIALFRSRAFLGHDTGDHVENPARILAIDTELQRAGLLAGRRETLFGPATFQQAGAVHDPRYLHALVTISEQGGGWIDGDTYCGPDSLHTARLAAGAAIAAVDHALDVPSGRACALGRPPGHHATAARGMGFCLVNSVAVAAAHALARGVERVAIFDWDVHHGNGTQDIFYERDDVLFCSMHQYGDFYPGSGAASERGRGKGLGYTINAPMNAGADAAAYLDRFDAEFAPTLLAFRPGLILISAGFDAHASDPLGSMSLTESGFGELTSRIIDIANATSEGRIVAVLEGGYDGPALGRSVAEMVRRLDGSVTGTLDRHGEADSS